MMNRAVSSRSGRLSFGQKWQNNIEGSNEIEESHSAASESGDGRHSADPVESTEIVDQVSVTQPAGNTIPIPTSAGVNAAAAAPPPTPIERKPKGSTENQIMEVLMLWRHGGELMYQAALQGDWRLAEGLLKRDETLACVDVTERGDRALHVAAATNHTKFVQKLVEHMSPEDLELMDGKGQTACCYAAISGNVEIADVLLKKNKNLGTLRDQKEITPLHKAALRGKALMVSYFLKSIKVEDLSNLQEWFDLLLVTIRSKMYDVALEILEKDGSLATMRDDKEGITALHMLARQDTSDDSTTKTSILLKSLFGVDVAWNDFFTRKTQSDLRLSLAMKLWDEIKKSMDKASRLKLIKKPSVLHDAAKVGNVELITMLTRTYPDLIWDTDSEEHTIFHIAVIHRQESVFKLIHQIGAMTDFIATSGEDDGNNILHLAAKRLDRSGKIVSQSARQMHRELAWFKKVEAIVPPSCLEMKNVEGQTPRELFSKQHKDLFEKSEEWMRNTADSCMLIATIMLTVVFAAAFTPPGGNNSETGIPILILKKTPIPFASFVIFEGLALFGSIFSIVMFWSIMTSSFEEDQFLEILPFQLKLGLSGLLVSLIGAISAFISAYFLVFIDTSARLVNSFIALAYFSLVVVICCKIASIWEGITSRPSRRLFKISSERKKEINSAKSLVARWRRLTH